MEVVVCFYLMIEHPLDLAEFFPPRMSREAGVRLALQRIASPRLTVEEVPYRVDGGHFTNYYLHVGSKPWEVDHFFDAHYDVANSLSENFQDNTSSVLHLLYLASRPDFSGSIALTDAEEMVSYQHSGARVLAEHLTRRVGRLPTAVVLELTGRGSTIWTSPEAPDCGQDLVIQCPINNSKFYSRGGLPSFCVGTLPEEGTDCWSVCHGLEDTFDQADREGMSHFNDWLTRFNEYR